MAVLWCTPSFPLSLTLLGSESGGPSSSLFTEKHLVFGVTEDNHMQPTGVQICSATPTRRGETPANELRTSGMCTVCVCALLYVCMSSHARLCVQYLCVCKHTFLYLLLTPSNTRTTPFHTQLIHLMSAYTFLAPRMQVP